MVGDRCGLSEGDAGVELGGGDGRDDPTIRTCRGLCGAIVASSKFLTVLTTWVACGSCLWEAAESGEENELEEGAERRVEKEDDEGERDGERPGEKKDDISNGGYI